MCSLKMYATFQHVLTWVLNVCVCVNVCYNIRTWNLQGVSINMKKFHKEGPVES